jgi:Tol biopolymer transport system component
MKHASFLICALLLLPACSKDKTTVAPPVDATPPAAVGDLTATVTAAADSIVLAWTAPGDDGVDGQAALYDIRYAANRPIEAGDWDSATPLPDPPLPGAPGQPESLRVGGLPSGTWGFALKAADEVPNWSDVSNSPWATLPDLVGPGPVQDLTVSGVSLTSVTLTWTAPGDDGGTGTAAEYDLGFSEETITEENWADATRVQDLPAPRHPGEAESFTVTGLQFITTYFFALRSADESGHWSDLSNVLEAQTATTGQVTFSPGGFGSAFSPSWSPDGTRLVFAATWAGNADLYIISLAGGDPVRLTDDPAEDTNPRWSPDGKAIAFESKRGGEFYEIWRIDAVPGAEAVRVDQIAGENIRDAAWSPDGTRIAYRTGSPGQLYETTDLFAIPVDGGPRELLATGDGQPIVQPSWSPDGQRIAVVSGRAISWDIWIIPLDGGDWSRVTVSHLDYQNLNPQFSPDGSRIAFASNWTGTYEIYTIAPEGGVRTKVSGGSGSKTDPAWSPDGKMLAYSSDKSGNWDIWVQILE